MVVNDYNMKIIITESQYKKYKHLFEQSVYDDEENDSNTDYNNEDTYTKEGTIIEGEIGSEPIKFRYAEENVLDNGEIEYYGEISFKGKKYSDSLFFGHIVLEKILKALVVKEIKEQALFTHNLVKLEEAAKLDFNKKSIEFLNQINDFNIRARYPEKKLAFYKKCTPKYTE